jgi:hypothetical protein
VAGVTAVLPRAPSDSGSLLSLRISFTRFAPDSLNVLDLSTHPRAVDWLSLDCTGARFIEPNGCSTMALRAQFRMIVEALLHRVQDPFGSELIPVSVRRSTRTDSVLATGLDTAGSFKDAAQQPLQPTSGTGLVPTFNSSC